MNIDGNEHIPFSLFISSQRRRKILQAIMPDPKAPYLQKDGERILTNYRKQIAERLAREEQEAVGAMSHPSSKESKRNTMTSMKSSKSTRSQKRKEAEDREQKLINQKLHEISHFNGEPPEESVLLDIIKRKKK
jgi:hypothetical protein